MRDFPIINNIFIEMEQIKMPFSYEGIETAFNNSDLLGNLTFFKLVFYSLNQFIQMTQNNDMCSYSFYGYKLLTNNNFELLLKVYNSIRFVIENLRILYNNNNLIAEEKLFIKRSLNDIWVLTSELSQIDIEKKNNENYFKLFEIIISFINEMFEQFSRNDEYKTEIMKSFKSLFYYFMRIISLKQKEKTEESLKKLIDLIIKISQLRFNSEYIIGNVINTSSYILDIIEKYIVFYDDNKNIQKHSIEILLKKLFVNSNEEIITNNEMENSHEIYNKFYSNGKLFSEIFNNLIIQTGVGIYEIRRNKSNFFNIIYILNYFRNFRNQ